MDLETRSKRARELLRDPVLTEALQAVTDRAISDWRNTQPANTVAREAAWYLVQAVTALKTELDSIANTSAVRKFNNRRAL